MFGLGLALMLVGFVIFASQLTGDAAGALTGLAMVGIGNLLAFIAVIGWGVKYGTLAARAHTS